MKKGKINSFLEAKQKIEAWCAYQERCHSDVYKKLMDLGVDNEDANVLISHLIQYNFLNEQRYADSYVSGKFNIKKWGKRKIYIHLKQKNIPQKCIDSALKNINDDEYLSQLKILAKKKWNERKGTDFEKKIKTQRFLLGKGYEHELIYEVLASISDD
ncbi:MAG: regulatory protein RecX [Brumimicrobium sp.]